MKNFELKKVLYELLIFHLPNNGIEKNKIKTSLKILLKGNVLVQKINWTEEKKILFPIHAKKKKIASLERNVI